MQPLLLPTCGPELDSPTFARGQGQPPSGGSMEGTWARVPILGS